MPHTAEQTTSPRNIVSTNETPDVASSTEDYARRFSGGVGAYFLEVQASRVLQMLKPWPGASVLDVGGGHAQLVGPLSRHGYQVTVLGSDASCRQRLEPLLETDSFEFQTGALLDMPFETNAFDVVVAVRMLPHLEDWPRFVSEMCRVARRAVVVDYPDKRSFNALSDMMFGAKKALEGNTRPYRCFRRRELLGEFDRGRFGSPLFRPQFFLPMVVHRTMRLPPVSKALETLARSAGLTRLFGSPVILRVTSE